MIRGKEEKVRSKLFIRLVHRTLIYLDIHIPPTFMGIPATITCIRREGMVGGRAVHITIPWLQNVAQRFHQILGSVFHQHKDYQESTPSSLCSQAGCLCLSHCTLLVTQSTLCMQESYRLHTHTQHSQTCRMARQYFSLKSAKISSFLYLLMETS